MEILEILYEEKGLLLNMVDVLKAERQALINDDINKLKTTVKAKEELKNKIDDIEKLRVEKCGNKRIREILLLFEDNDSKEVKALEKEIKDAVFNIEEVNNTNRLLIKQSLNYIKVVMNILSPPNVKLYNSTGSVNDGRSSNGIFDTSV